MRYLGIDSTDDRRRIQALRAQPPGLAQRRGARRRVFGSALGQWDALIEASSAVVPDAAPILIFYALSQAGRAICASAIHGQPWRSSGHGLRIGDPSGGLGATTVTPDGGPNTSFAMLCRATNSPLLTAGTTLGRLWASNPKLEQTADLGKGEPALIEITCISSGEEPTRGLISGEVVRGLPLDSEQMAAELARRLSSYPGAGEGLVLAAAQPQHQRGAGSRVEIGWRDAQGTARPISAVAPGLGNEKSGAFLRAALNDEGDVLGPLALWWATLLALSSLARYHPEEWVAALARDKSPSAIAIEDALDAARELIPWMLLGSLKANGE